jgi:4,5-dihydroxyphthalate decarboxylase
MNDPPFSSSIGLMVCYYTAMAGRSLKTVTRTQGNNKALKDGTVAPAGFDLDFEEIPVLVDGFRRMVRGLEFDVCEMAITTYLCAKAHGKRFTALPIFLVRGFHHGAIVRNTNNGDVRTPKDVEGRTVGVNRGYTVTTGVWARGVLATEHGVDLDKVTWALSGDEHVQEYRPPANVVPANGKLPDLLASGEHAASIGIEWDDQAKATLIPNATEAGYQALRERGHYPINHLDVVRDDLLQEYPDLAVSIFEAFAESKRRYVDLLRKDAIESPTKVDQLHRRVMEITGDDPLPYGIEPNRAVLEELIGYAVDQHILGEAPTIEDMFAEATRDITG